MLNAFIKNLQIPDTIIQVGSLSAVGRIIKYGESFDLEGYVAENQNKDLYFLAGVKPDLTGRASDDDIVSKNYFSFDFDIREFEKKSGRDIDNFYLRELAAEILLTLDKHEYLSTYSYAVLSGNGLHLHYLGDAIQVSNVHYFKAGIRQLIDEVNKISPIPADTACINPARLMRLPTSVNQKNGFTTRFTKTQKQISPLLLKILTMGQKRIELMEREAKAAAQRIIKFEFPEVDDSEYQAIDNIPIQNLICAEFGWEYIDRHFRAPGTTKLKACFIGKDGNYVVHGSTDHFSDEHKGYNSFRFIRMMHRLDNAGTFRWFENEFPEIGELARQKRIEYKQKQAPALEGGVLLSILANDRQKLNKIIDQIPDDFDLSELPALLDEAFSLMARLNGAEAYSILKHKLKKRFGLTNDDIKRYEKVIAQRRKAYSAAIILDVQDKECNEALTEDETIKAEELLKSQTLLFDVLKAIKSLRVVGEEENILIIYLVLTSRLLAQPLSLEIKGDSSTGKSYPPNQIVKIFPPSAYKALTGMTAQSMYYSKPDEFKHRILLIFERHGSEKADYTIRSFQSEGRLELQTTIKDPLTGEFKAVTKSIEGPIGVIETTTSAMIHSENETRNLSIYTDQSKEQTIRILNNINAQYLPGSGVSFNTKPWRNIQQILNKYKVVISFGSSISKRLPPAFIETSRIRRDYSKLLGLIEVSAILHQKQRQIINVNGEEYLEATLADYYIAKIIAEGSFSKTIQEMPVQTTIILKKIEELQLEKLMESGEDVMPDDIAAKHLAYTFTVRVLAEKLGGDKSNIYKWLGPAIAKNYIIEEAEHKGSRGAIYRLNFNKKFLEQESFPEVEELLSDLPDNYECIDEIYNPITGDRVEIDKNKIKEHKNTQPKLKTPDNLVANKQDEPTKTNTNSNFNNRIIIDGPVSIDTGQNIGMNSPTPPWLNRSNKSHDDNYIGDKGEFDVDSIPF